MSIFRMMTRMALISSMNGNKGMNGEKAVRRVLRYFYAQEMPYEQLDNVGFYDEDGMSHQIDHIVIRENGIFCIETKNIGGFIFGDETSGVWTQCLAENKRRTFLNPLNQNETHIKQINNALDNKYKVNNLVVMVQNNAERVESSKVINLSDLVPYLLSFDDGTKLSKEEIHSICEVLLSKSKYITKKEHIRNLKRKQVNQPISEDVDDKEI